MLERGEGELENKRSHSAGLGLHSKAGGAQQMLESCTEGLIRVRGSRNKPVTEREGGGRAGSGNKKE